MNARGYMQTRSLEAGLAILMLAVGLQLWREGDTFAAPIYAAMRRYLAEDVGGLVLALTGTLRLIALVLNSHVVQTPLLRFVGCMTGVAFWLNFALVVQAGAEEARLANPVLVPICAALSALELFSAFRSAADANTLDSLGLQRRAFRRTHRTEI